MYLTILRLEVMIIDAIEAAAMAAAEKAFSDAFHDMNVGDGQPLKAAIAAYLEATGVERDAERWRWGVKNARWVRHEHEAYIAVPVSRDADLSCVAMRNAAIDSARGGEHG